MRTQGDGQSFGNRDGALGELVEADDSDLSLGGEAGALEGTEGKGIGRCADAVDGHFDVEDVIVVDGGEEVALDMNTRESVVAEGLGGVSQAEFAEELLFRCFEVAEHGGVVNPLRGVSIGEAHTHSPAIGFSNVQFVMLPAGAASKRPDSVKPQRKLNFFIL